MPTEPQCVVCPAILSTTAPLCQKVLSLMASARDPHVAENGCEALRNLVVDEETRQPVSKKRQSFPVWV